jgi:NAD-dependent deacetylase
VREAEYAGARTLLVNLEPPSPPNPYFNEVLLGRAEEILPVLLGDASQPEH